MIIIHLNTYLEHPKIVFGCGLYSKNNITYHRWEDLSESFSITGCEFEAVWVEIINKKGPNILIAVIYRHPGKSDIKSFLDYLI